MGEYQLNYDHNSSRRDDRLVEMNMAVENQVDYSKEIEREMEQQQSCLNYFFTQKSDGFRLKLVMKAWRSYFAVYKRKARLAAFTRNNLYRKKMKRLFTSWRGVTHEEFTVRLDHEKTTFRTELESQILVQWSTKVNALLLYVAELEDKIKEEQEAREQLAEIYDASLNVGHNRLVTETLRLQQNPLIHEVNCDGCEIEDPQTRIQTIKSRIQERMMTELAQRKNSEQSIASETHTFNYQANSHVQQQQ